MSHSIWKGNEFGNLGWNMEFPHAVLTSLKVYLVFSEYWDWLLIRFYSYIAEIWTTCTLRILQGPVWWHSSLNLILWHCLPIWESAFQQLHFWSSFLLMTWERVGDGPSSWTSVPKQKTWKKYFWLKTSDWFSSSNHLGSEHADGGTSLYLSSPLCKIWLSNRIFKNYTYV